MRDPLVLSVLLACVLLLGVAALAWHQVRARNMQKWLGSYARTSGSRRAPGSGDEIHALICVADHYEPCHGKPSPEVAQGRVDRWVEQYPKLFGRFRDSDGRPPRHSFFYPIDEYVEAHLDGVADLCRAGYGEVEVHLHHHDDTAEGTAEKLLCAKDVYSRRHGMLSRDRATGELAYLFIHGNWALDNSHPLGHRCGVNNELDVLRETGCRADMTLPSAPNAAQTSKINGIYYATDDPQRPKSHDTGVDVQAGRAAPPNSLLMIQGPLLLDWRHRKFGLMPRIENGNLQDNQPPTMDRLDLWLRARVQVPSRPDWFFVKLYTHGAPESNQAVVLGEPMVKFHEGLARRRAENPKFHYHYVTAREMYNLAKAAEAGWAGSVAEALDFELVFNGREALGGVHRGVQHAS